jgi:hypothetical protein
VHLENAPLLLRTVRSWTREKDKIQNGENIRIYLNIYSETSIHRSCRGSGKETMDPGKQ